MTLPSTTQFKFFRASFWFSIACIAALIGLLIARSLHWISARTLEDIIFVATPALFMLIALCGISHRIAYEHARDHKWQYCIHCGYDLASSQSPCPECGAEYTPDLLAKEWELRLRPRLWGR